MNEMTKTICVLAMAACSAAAFGEPFATADFTETTGRIKEMMHCSSWAPRSYPRGLVNDDELLKPLRLKAFRTHDAPLVNHGQEIIDTHCIFPLMHLDAKDPKNYIFKPTDHWLKLGRDMGMKVMYRMGSSIEHTGKWGYNTLNPTNHEQYAEVLAGIVRHYTKGWADGFEWDIRYWELFNEPDVHACWRGTKDEMVHLYVTCLKRLKSEFPDLKVGGPAFGWCNGAYITDILKACKRENVRPDFVAWHYYGQKIQDIVAQPFCISNVCAQCGFDKMELVLDEWHYLISWDGIQASSSPDMVMQATEGVTGINKIDSAVFTISVLARFQDTMLDQSYFYGSGFDGSWGYVDKYRRFTKVYYAMKMNGDLCNDFTDKVKCTYDAAKNKTVFGAWSKDRRKACLIVADYRGTDQTLEVAVKGLEKAKYVSCVVLDNGRDLLDCPYEFRNGILKLTKAERRSAAYMLTFEM